MDFSNFQFILNNHFIIRHCTAREGFDTPSSFHCIKGLRKWSRFFYLHKGIIDFTYNDGKKLRIKSGDILFLPYNIEYHSSWIESQNGHYFTVEFILEYPNGDNLNLFDDIHYLFNDTGKFRGIFEEMKNTVLNSAPGFHLKFQEQLMHLFYIMAMHIKEADIRYIDIQSAISVIENNLNDELDINKLAEMCCMSPATFRRKFLKYSSMSPIKYRNFLRLTKARELIYTGLYQISEAAAIVGIDDVYYFSKLYKNQFGISPSNDLPKD